MKFITRTHGQYGRLGVSVSASKLGIVFLFVTTFLVSSISCKKHNSTSPVFSIEAESGKSDAKNVIVATSANDTVSAESSSATSFTVGTSRQARDYNPGGGSAAGNSYSVGGGTGSHASASSYGAPAVGGGGGGYGNVAAGGGYPNPQYAIPPIVLQQQGGYGMSGGGWGAEEDDFGDFGGEDLKSYIGLLGLKGLKGLKGVKAVKALKGLGLLALAPLAPLLLPLLPLLPILLPLLLLAPLILPLLLLLFLPVPVISIPNGRRKRDLSSGGSSSITTSKTLLQETMDDIMSQIPSDFASLRWKDVDQCMDKFICDTGMMVSRVAPSMATPAAWLLAKLWPEPLQSKVETFRKVTEMMKYNKKPGHFSNPNNFYYSYNLHPAKHSSGICTTNYKCRVKKLENLFHNLVVQQTEKLKGKLIERIPPGEMSPANIFRALLT